jgi:hypothetical protein
VSYEHCEKHDEDATNGCMACEKERVAALTDADVISELSAMASGNYRRTPEEPMFVRANEIRKRLSKGLEESVGESCVESLRRMAKQARDNLTDREREILDKHFTPPRRADSTAALRTELGEGKYTRWMARLSDGELVGLLWLVGEYAARSDSQEHDIAKFDHPGDRRKYGALNGIAAFKRKPMSLDLVRLFMRNCVNGE